MNSLWRVMSIGSGFFGLTVLCLNVEARSGLLGRGACDSEHHPSRPLPTGSGGGDGVQAWVCVWLLRTATETVSDIQPRRSWLNPSKSKQADKNSHSHAFQHLGSYADADQGALRKTPLWHP